MDRDDLKTYIIRAIAELYKGAKVSDDSYVNTLSHFPPIHFTDFLKVLANATWICGGTTDRSCNAPKRQEGVSSDKIAISVCLVIILVGGFAAFACAQRKRRTRR